MAKQTVLDQFYKSERLYRGMPMVRTSDGYLVPWDKSRIVEQLLEETQLAKKMFNLEPISPEYAEKIADEIERRIKMMRPKFVSGSLIREAVNNLLLEWSEEVPEFQIYRNLLTRVGAPVYDAYQIDTGNGWEARENANLQPNPETVHKKKADRLSKEEYLLLLPPELATAHHQGDIHIHTLEYFGTRPFCQDWDLRYFFYYGLLPDGTGFRSSAAGPAKHPEVALLHSVKVLAAGQTNFSGGQGFMYYTMFLAPFLRGLDYSRVKQLAQMMFYELTQTYVTRGGQLVFSNIQLPMGVPEIWRDVPVVMRGRIGPDVYGNYEDEVQTFFRAITEVAYEGDYWGKPFNFPKNEYYLSPEFFKPEYDELWMLVHRSVAKYGIPYFDNMLPGYRGYGKGVSCYQCLLPGEHIICMEGDWIRLVDVAGLRPGMKLLSYSPYSSEPRFSDFKDLLVKPYTGKALSVILRGGRRIRVTADHPITIRRGRGLMTIPAKNLKPGDEVPIVLNFSRRVINEIGVDKEILGTPSHHTLTERIKVDERLAEFLGLYLAEGDARKIEGGGMVRLSFGLHEAPLAERAASLIREVFGVPASIHRLKTALVVQAGCIQLYKFLVEQLGAGSNSRDKDVPDVVLHFPKEAIWSFIKAVYKGSGRPSRGWNQLGDESLSLQIRVRSKKAAVKLVLLSGLIGLPLKYYEHRYGRGDERIYVCRLSSKAMVKAFMEDRPLVEEDVIYQKVRRIIEEDYSGLVYDPVEVEGNHFSSALGIVTHNCCAYNFVATPGTDPKFKEKLYFEDGQHFSLGGWQVVSINMPRLAYRANGDYDRLLEAARENMRLAVEVFKAKRMWMERAINNNLIPFATQRPRDPRTGGRGPPAVDFDELVYVIGVVGVNEMVQHFTGSQLHESQDAVRLALRLLLDMEKYRRGLELQTGMKIVLARTPAESTAQTFAVADLLSPNYRKFARNLVKGDLEQASTLYKGNRDIPVYYSNGTHTYVGARISLGQKIDIEHKFFPILSGGNIFHIWLGEAAPDPEALYKVTQRIARNTQIGYFSYTKDLTVCSSCQNTSSGLLESCPNCGSKEVRWWSRITGYYTDVTGWNEGKKMELKDRYRISI